VYAEFQRITNQNLPNTFYAAFDRHLPRLMAIFRQKAFKTGKTADALAEIFKIHDEQELHDINTRRTTVIHALPLYLQEDTSGFFRTCTEESEPELGDVAVALLTVISDNGTSQVQYQPVTISVVIENDIVNAWQRGRVGAALQEPFQHAAAMPSYLGLAFVVMRDGGQCVLCSDCL
ncbi:Biogenesis of lysosome-related organelles complex 1 subunit BLI1, partial [Dissostichus eleginoides]